MSTVDTRLTPLARGFILACALVVLAAELWPTPAPRTQAGNRRSDATRLTETDAAGRVIMADAGR
jgi:hypothetical protein